MKKLMLALAAVCCLVASPRAALAQASSQEWPQQPIRIIVAFGAGGGADIIGRILADAMQERLGKPVIVENKPGAGGILGNELVANAAPDGYTLGVMTAGQIIAAVTRKDMPYDTAALTPVAQVASASLLIATRPDFPADNVKELIAAAKADPGKIVSASPGFAATQHFAGELFKQIAGVNLLHVPFRSSPEVINAVLGHHADVMFDTVSALIGQVQSGALKALAVTGKERFPAVPNVPATSESGLLPGYDVTTWYGVRPGRHAGCGRRHAEQDADGYHCRRQDTAAPGGGRRRRQRLYPSGIRRVHEGRVQEMERRARSRRHCTAVNPSVEYAR
jgi:tripartite-type tricarboxylate transporter receptor subunit TctC